jgi:hypothetical protein
MRVENHAFAGIDAISGKREHRLPRPGARVVANVQAATLNAFIRETVSHKVSLLCTDQWPGYNCLDKDFPRASTSLAQFTLKPSKAFGRSSSAV